MAGTKANTSAECHLCGSSHGPQGQCERLRQVALSLSLFAVPAFLTDPLNRFVWVNQQFASLVGDPIRDRVPPNLRFIPAAVVVPYRERFPRGSREVAQCLLALPREVSGGRLGRSTLGLLQETLALDPVRRAARKTDSEWDGTLVISGRDGGMVVIREQVVPVSGAQGGPSGYSISLWPNVEQEVPSLDDQLDDVTSLASLLTPRQLEVASWYGSGLNSRKVAERAGITPGTARAHLEEIYSRLQIHSRAELAALLVREGLA